MMTKSSLPLAMVALLPAAAASALLFAFSSSAATATPVSITSPDGRTVLTFDVKELDGAAGCPVYRVDFKGKPVVAESRLGLEIEGAPLVDGLSVVQQSPGKRDETWKPVCGERAVVRDRCNTLGIDLKESKAPGRALRVDVRVYDEGAAFCYTLPKQPGLDRVVVARERTEFRLAGDHPAWATYAAQGKYEKVPVSRIKPGCERPLVLQAADDLYIALGEARLVDYARMKFAALPGASPAVVSHLDGKVEAALPLTTPWRYVMAAESPGRLLENNDLLPNLNDPCAIADPSWIRPGKVIREVTLTTAGGKACVDFAAKRGLQFVEFDAGWYGNEYDDASDASAVNLDPKRSKGPLDLPEVIRYGKEKNVGVILYVNRRALEKQLDPILPLYRSWGVAGVKYGFVNVGSQHWTSWLHDAIRKAAAQKLMVDVHDEYRGTGYSRTYPNLLTVEGIGGDETSPVNEQTLTLQFVRYLAGPADNTICYYDRRVDANATHAYQLAKAVCLFSPWQFLYWYDRPASSQDEPELEFYDRVPTVWDDTKVLHGRIGEYAAIARRRGDAWFIGVMNSGEARTLDLPLGFLEKGKRYAAHVYSDDPTVATRTKVKIERFAVTAETTLRAAVSEKGGQAIRIAPAGAGEAYPPYK